MQAQTSKNNYYNNSVKIRWVYTQHSNTKNYFTVTAIAYNPLFKLLLTPPGCGSQWILSAPP